MNAPSATALSDEPVPASAHLPSTLAPAKTKRADGSKEEVAQNLDWLEGATRVAPQPEKRQ